MTLISSGCLLLNLALGGGYPIGRVVNVVGAEAAGKSLLMAEMIYNAKLTFKDKLIWRYNDTENKFDFDTMEMYGLDIIQEESSVSLEDFGSDFITKLNCIKEDQILFYVLDSLDETPSEAEIERGVESVKAREKGDKIEQGTYNLEKQKELGSFFRLRKKDIKDKNCILFVISQVRVNLKKFGAKYYRTGGKALDHAASQIIWLKEIEKYTKRGRATGVCVHAKVSKNSIGKPFRECYFDILFDYGVDNLTSNINFLYDLKTPLGKERKLRAFAWNGKEYTKEALIKLIEKNNLEKELEQKVIKKWNDIEEEIAPRNRKGKEKWKV